MNYITLATDINSMSKAELSAVTTVSGVTIVFGMLLLLVIMIWLFGLIGKSANKSAKKADKKAKIVKEKVVKTTQVPTSTATASDNDEVIAVISAAIAMMYEGTGKTAVVRSIRPVSVSRSAWADAGRRDNVRAF